MENRPDSKTRKLSLAALLTAIALIFSYVEFLVPISVGIPGVKLGLANITIVLCLYILNWKYALAVNAARIALSALLFGNSFSLIYAASGAAISFAFMLMLKKCKCFSVIGVSMGGGVLHNLGQLLIAAYIMQSPKIMMYFPVLVISGMICGILTGYIAFLVIKSAKKANMVWK